jgi:nucleoside 2-deoxyribosyltransferase
MAFDARVLQILIASPGDVQEERKIISEVIYEWNYVNSLEKSVVLLPLRWETHASPEMGSPPQAVINRQVVDNCDMAIAVFWQRLGTPTSEAESGTAEEIARVGNAGKPVMLYFSNRHPDDLDSLDLDEIARVREFKKAKYPEGLIEHYGSENEFRDKLQKQLAMKVREIISADTAEQGTSTAPNIELSFAVGDPPRVISPSNTVGLTHIICTDLDSIPDYSDETSRIVPVSKGGNLFSNSTFVATTNNKDYYRELVAYVCELYLRRQLRLVVSGSPDQMLRDIYLDMKVHDDKGIVKIDPPSIPYPSSTATYTSGGFNFGDSAIPRQVSIEHIADGEWRIEATIPVIQAQRTVILNDSFTIRAAETSAVIFDATIYSSAPPFSLNAELQIDVETQEMSYRQILELILPGYNSTEDS